MRTQIGTGGEDPGTPLGGVKNSGDGRFGGKAGTAEFTNLPAVTLQTIQRHYRF